MRGNVGQSQQQPAASGGVLGSAGPCSGGTGPKTSGAVKAGARALWKQPSIPHQQNTSSEQKQKGFCFPVGLLCWVLQASRPPHRSTPFSQSKITPIPFLCYYMSGHHTSGRVHGNAPERLLRCSPPVAQPARPRGSAAAPAAPGRAETSLAPAAARRDACRWACGRRAPAPAALRQPVLVLLPLLLLAVVLLCGP